MAAVGLLILVVVVLSASIEGYNQLVIGLGADAPLVLDAFVRAAHADPFGPDGFWVTFMLLSTLVPTFVHLVILALAVLSELPFGRLWLAQRIERHRCVMIRDLAALYLTGMLAVAVALAGGFFWGFPTLIAWFGESVPDHLLDLSLGTIDLVRGLARA